MFSEWRVFVVVILVVFSGVDSRRRNRRRTRENTQSSPSVNTDTTMTKRQRMIDMRESLADSLSTNRVKVFLLDNGSPQLVKGRAAIRRMSARHEEMTSAQVRRLINLLEKRIRAIDKELTSESRKATNSQTVTTNHETNGVTDRGMNEVSRRLLVNGRLRAPTRSSGRMGIPSTFRSETVDRGRFSVPLGRNRQTIQRTSGTTRQISSRIAVSSSRVSPSFEERLRHSQRSSRPTGSVSLDLRSNSSPQVRNGGDAWSSSDRTLQSRLNTAGRVGNTGVNDRGQVPVLTNNDLKNRAPNTPFRDFLTATQPSNPELPESSVSGTKTTQEPVVRHGTTTATSKAEVGGSVRTAKTKLTTNQTTRIQTEVKEKKLSYTTRSPNNIPVTLLNSSSQTTSSSDIHVTPAKTTSQSIPKPTSTASASANVVPFNTESHVMLKANEKKDTPTDVSVQVLPQEEPANPVLPMSVGQQKPTEKPQQVAPQEETNNSLLPVPKQKPRTSTLLPASAEPKIVLHSTELKASPTTATGSEKTETRTAKTTTIITTKKQEENNQTKTTKGTASSNRPTPSAKSVPTSEIPSTQQTLADQLASAQIPSPTKMSLHSTIDTPKHTLSKDKPSPTSVPKERTTLQMELQKMIAKHREQETLRTGSATGHEEQMKAIKQLLAEIAGSASNTPVPQVQTTTPIPVQQILQLLQAQEVPAALPVPRSTAQSILFNDIIALMQAKEARTSIPTQAAHVNQLPLHQQHLSFNGHPMMHQHRVVDPLEQQRIAMMSQMGNPMAGMFGGMMGYMNPEMMQEMMFGDTTDAPDPIKHEESHKGEEQEGIARPPTTPAPTTTTVTSALPLRHHTPLKLQPHHQTVRDPHIPAYPQTREPSRNSQWQEMDAAHLNTRHGYLPYNSDALTAVKQSQRPLSDLQMRKQHQHKHNVLKTQDPIKGPAMLESQSRPKQSFSPTADPNMLLKIKSSIERALESAGIAKDVDIVLTDNTEEQTTLPTTNGNTILKRIKTSIENTLQSAGISKNVKLVLKHKQEDTKQTHVVTKAPVITTKSVLKPTKDSSWITQEGSYVTDVQTKPTTKMANEALHGGMSFLSYSERPAKIPVDSSNHVYVQHNVRQRKHKENLTPHPLDSLMIGHITTAAPNDRTLKSKDLPRNVELLGGFTPDINKNEQGNRLTRGMAKIHNHPTGKTMVEDGWKVLPVDFHSPATNNVMNQVDKAETVQIKPDSIVPPPPPMNHIIPSQSRTPTNEPTKTTDVQLEHKKPKVQSEKSKIVNKLIQALSASEHKGLLDSLSNILLGKPAKHVVDEKTTQSPESSQKTGHGHITTGVGSMIAPSVKSQTKHTADIPHLTSSSAFVLSQAPNKIHSALNHLISAPLEYYEPRKSNDKVFERMNAMPHKPYESKTLSNNVKSPSAIEIMDSVNTSPIQVSAQAEIASTQNKKTLEKDPGIRLNIAAKHRTLNHHVLPSNPPRMIHTTKANTFSGANLFLRRTQSHPSHTDTELHQTRILQQGDALYQQEDASLRKQTQAIQPEIHSTF